MNRPGIIITTLLAAFAFTGTALADEYSPSEDAQRRGIMVGIGINGGHIKYDSTDGSGDGDTLNESAGAELHIAYMIGKKLAVSVEGWGMRHDTETILGDLSITHIIATIGPQYWVLPRLWIRGGLGYARYQGTLDSPIGEISNESEDVLGVALSLGLEVISGRNFALDIQLRGGTGFYEDVNASNVGVGIGFTWF